MESLSDYVIHMEHAMKELEKQGVKLHEIAVGYVMFKHANLLDVQEGQMLAWGQGKYDRKAVVTNLCDDDYIYIGEDDLEKIYEEEHVRRALATYQDICRSIRD